MKTIEKALAKAANLRTSSFLIFYIFIAIIAVFYLIDSEMRIIDICSVFLILIIDLTTYILMKNNIKKKNKFKNSQLYFKLKKLSCENEFVASVDNEISEKLIANFKNKCYAIDIFITEKWFIFISSNGMLACRCSDVSDVRLENNLETDKEQIVIEYGNSREFSVCLMMYNEEILDFLKEYLK